MPEAQGPPATQSFPQRPLANPWDGGHGTRDTSCFQMVALAGQEVPRGQDSAWGQGADEERGGPGPPRRGPPVPTSATLALPEKLWYHRGRRAAFAPVPHTLEFPE